MNFKAKVRGGTYERFTAHNHLPLKDDDVEKGGASRDSSKKEEIGTNTLTRALVDDTKVLQK